MNALLRYQGALLLRSQRWLPPVLLYVAVLAVGFRPGDPVPDSLGYAAAPLVPVTAWLVRVCVTSEPDAARDCAAAAAGPLRVHAAALLTALGWGSATGGIGGAAVLLLGEHAGLDMPATALAGASAVLVCTLTGTAVGALCGRPLMKAPGYAVPAAALGSLLALVTAGSPARVAVTGLVTGSVEVTPGAPAGAVALACAAGAVACVASARRG
ncbi:ABC transporter [Streptomyces sp. APSN-46.1]|uniref:ABC transporter n=1 Tax=Streptomyces sp. APSN-46.1 TaxID=2929049 RepID=UPI001FB459AC|nr:ABC transporter [Streptomyces sp. APSN-46.1]MCJ1680526.1 ABC transporter [Streptomyces sp. APSN-46.1]